MSLIFGIFVFCERLKYHAQFGRAWMKFFFLEPLDLVYVIEQLKRYFKRRSLLTWYKCENACRRTWYLRLIFRFDQA